MDKSSEITLEETVASAAWTHNTNVMISRYNPLMLMTGKSVVYPRVLKENIASVSMYDDEGVRKVMENHFEVGRKSRKLEFGAKLDKAMSTRMKGFENMIIQKDDKAFYPTNNEKAWLGPAKVLNVDKNW